MAKKKKCDTMGCKNSKICWACGLVVLAIIAFVWATWDYIPYDKLGFPAAPGGEAADYSWKYCRVEPGSTSISNTNSSNSVSLATPITDTSQAFLLYDSTGDSGVVNGEDHLVIGYIDDANTLMFERGGNSGTARISYHLVECFNNEFNVLRGQTTLGSGDNSTTVTIPAVDPDRSIVLVGGGTTAASPSESTGLFVADLTDSTTLRFRRGNTGAGAKVAGEVIEFNTSSGVSVQSGEMIMGTADSLISDTIDPVDPDHSWIYCSMGADADSLRASSMGCDLTDSTTVSFDRGGPAVANHRIVYYVVEFPASVKVQRGMVQDNPSSTDGNLYTQDITVEAMTAPDKVFSFVTNATRGTALQYPRNRWLERLSGPTTLQTAFWRGVGGSSDENIKYWQVIEFLQVSKAAFGSGGSSNGFDFPSLTGMIIDDGAACSPTRMVTLTIEAEDTAEVLISNDPVFPSGPWREFTSPMTIEWDLEDPDGSKTVYALFRSEMGNLSTPVYDSIVLDQATGCLGGEGDGEVIPE